MINIQKKYIYSILYSIFILSLSFYFVPLYIYGDQQFYSDFYENCFYVNVDSFECYKNKLGTQEPLYYTLVLIMNYFNIDRNIFIIFSNAILAIMLCLNVYKFYVKDFTRNILIMFLLTNYYFVVLMFAAERLKFSVIFILLYLYFSSKYSIFYYILAILGHIQSVFLSFYVVLFEMLKIKKIWLRSLLVVFFGVCFGMFFIFFNEHISNKISAYSDDGGSIGSILKTLFFVLLSYWYSKNIKLLLCSLPLLVASFTLDVERVAIFAFFVLIGTIIYYKRKMDLALFFILIYFSYKSIEFMSNIIEYGAGYI
ncbi:MAG: hypothetical protein ACN6NJ_08925 [Acinetobacter sp.]